MSTSWDTSRTSSNIPQACSLTTCLSNNVTGPLQITFFLQLLHTSNHSVSRRKLFRRERPEMGLEGAHHIGVKECDSSSNIESKLPSPCIPSKSSWLPLRIPFHCHSQVPSSVILRTKEYLLPMTSHGDQVSGPV